jgi:hypothetical protein
MQLSLGQEPRRRAPGKASLQAACVSASGRADFNGADADSAQGGNQAFTFAEFGFTKTAGQMTLTFASGQTTLKLDVNGDGKADYQMKINGDVTHESGGWLL